MGLVVKIWKDPVWSKVISAAIIALAAGLWGHYEGIFTAANFARAGAAIWGFTTEDLYIPRVVFVAMMLVAFAGGAIWMRVKSRQEGRPGTKGDEPPIANGVQRVEGAYLTDLLFGFRWRWKIAARTGEVYAMKQYCPECDYELEASAFDYLFDGVVCECESCHYKRNLTSEPSLFINRAKLEAERRLRTGEWKAGQQAQG